MVSLPRILVDPPNLLINRSFCIRTWSLARRRCKLRSFRSSPLTPSPPPSTSSARSRSLPLLPRPSLQRLLLPLPPLLPPSLRLLRLQPPSSPPSHVRPPSLRLAHDRGRDRGLSQASPRVLHSSPEQSRFTPTLILLLLHRDLTPNELPPLQDEPSGLPVQVPPALFSHSFRPGRRRESRNNLRQHEGEREDPSGRLQGGEGVLVDGGGEGAGDL